MSEKEVRDAQVEGLVDLQSLINPFPGLRPFGVEESHLFFGREGQSDEVLSKLAENRFVSILGTSGSGKSSLMYCGLIPILHGGFLTHAGSQWRIIVARPGVNPIDNLAESLLFKDKSYASLKEEEKRIRKAISASTLRSSSLGLIEAVKQMKKQPDENILIVIDQFEELFRYNRIERKSSEANESLAFVNLLLEAINQPSATIYVALTMRSDFIGDCAQFPELTQKINDSHYLIPQMTRDQKKLAIEGPVAVGGGTIAPRLVQQLLNDVGDNPDQLPIMQHALMRTWSYWTRHNTGNEALDLRHYNAIGRMKEALSLHANEAYDELNKRQRKVCAILFKALTEAGNENSGIRRPTSLKTIAAIAGVTEEEVVKVIDRFREPGRSLLMPPYGVTLQSDTVVDISHESLMRNWNRLKSWVQEEAASANMYSKLSEAAENYQLGKTGLWRMPDLQLAINWREEQRPTLVWGQRYHPAFERTMVFLETSEIAYKTEQINKEKLQRRNLRRTRNFAIIAGLIGLVAIFLSVFAQIQSQEAQKQAVAAQVASEEAIKQQEIAELNATKAEQEAEAARIARLNADSSALKALREADRARLAEANARDQAAIAESRRVEAEQAKTVADQATTEALESAEVAERQRLIAEQQRMAADQLRYQSIARSLAIKSQQIEDPQQRGLIALQAYNFNERYEGQAFDPDIYNGLYGALKELKGDTLNQLKGHLGAVRAMSFLNKGNQLITAGSGGLILSWITGQDPTTLKPLTLASMPNQVVNSLAVSPSDEHLIAGLASGYVMIFNLNEVGKRDSLQSTQPSVLDIAFTPDDQSFFITGTANKIERCDFNSIETVFETSSRVNVIAVSPDGHWLAGGDAAGHVYLWDLQNTQEGKLIIEGRGHPVRSLSFNHAGNLLATGDDSDQALLTIYDLTSDRVLATKTEYNTRISDIAFSNDDRLLATASFDRIVRIYNTASINDLPVLLSDHDSWVWGVSFSADDQLLVTGSNEEIVRVWPTQIAEMADQFCDLLNRDLNQTEWNQYVGEDIDIENTCDN